MSHPCLCNPRIAALAAALICLQVPMARAESLVIGFAVGLSGYLAPFDTPTVDGARMAMDEINAAGGIGGTMRIESMIKDVRSETPQTSVAVKELLDAGADVIVVPCDDDPAIAGGLLAQAAQVPVFSTCATNAALPDAVGSFYFTNYVSDTAQGATLAQYAHQSGYGKAFILVSPDTTYTKNLPEYFAATLEKLGGKLIGATSFTLGQQDFSAEVTRIKGLQEPPDVIMTSAYEPDFPTFLKQLRAAGITAPVLGSDGIDSPTTVALGSVANGLVFTNAGNPAGNPALAAFFAKYEKVYGHPLTNAYAATGYEMIKIIAAAADRAGSIAGPRLRDAIDATTDFAGITGTISYAGRGRVPQRQIAINRIEDGKVVLVAATAVDPALIPAPKR